MALQNSLKKQLPVKDDNHIIGSIANPIIAVDNRGRITLFNQACEKLFGLTNNQVMGKLVAEIIPYTGLIKVLKTGKAHIGRKFVLGNALYVANRTPIVQGNSIVGAIGVIQEITELHYLAKELKQVTDQKNALESIFNNTNEGYISINSEGYINFINHAMAKLLNREPKNIINKHITEIIPEADIHLMKINGNAQQSKIMRIGNKKVLFSRYPVVTGGKVEGAVSKVVYQDLDKLAALANRSMQDKTKPNLSGVHYTLKEIIA